MTAKAHTQITSGNLVTSREASETKTTGFFQKSAQILKKPRVASAMVPKLNLSSAAFKHV